MECPIVEDLTLSGISLLLSVATLTHPIASATTGSSLQRPMCNPSALQSSVSAMCTVSHTLPRWSILMTPYIGMAS